MAIMMFYKFRNGSFAHIFCVLTGRPDHEPQNYDFFRIEWRGVPINEEAVLDKTAPRSN
jgi:hypothetical protein